MFVVGLVVFLCLFIVVVVFVRHLSSFVCVVSVHCLPCVVFVCIVSPLVVGVRCSL